MERSENYSGYTEQETEALGGLLRLTGAITEEKCYNDPDLLIRLLRARDFKVPEAFEMWKKWHEWRITYKAESITKEEMLPHIETGKAFYFSTDKLNRPCLIVRARNHWPAQFSIDETMRFSIYLVEKGVKKADKLGSKQICAIYDRGEMTSANRDNGLISLFRTLVSMLQDFYAERLGALYILHVNWFFWAIFQVIRPFLSAKTREKIYVLKNLNDLQHHFDESNLMREYGGSNSYVHAYPVTTPKAQ